MLSPRRRLTTIAVIDAMVAQDGKGELGRVARANSEKAKAAKRGHPPPEMDRPNFGDASPFMAELLEVGADLTPEEDALIELNRANGWTPPPLGPQVEQPAPDDAPVLVVTSGGDRVA